MRDGIDDEPTSITRALLGEHCAFVVDFARAIGQTRATIVRSIVADWIKSPTGVAAQDVVNQYRSKQAIKERLKRSSR